MNKRLMAMTIKKVKYSKTAFFSSNLGNGVTKMIRVVPYSDEFCTGIDEVIEYKLYVLIRPSQSMYHKSFNAAIVIRGKTIVASPITVSYDALL